MDISEPSWSRRLHIVAISLLLIELAIGVVFRNAGHLEGKGMILRAAFYPLCAVAVPIGWRMRGRAMPFPHLAGALLVVPFAFDIGGNLVGLFEVSRFDDVLHARMRTPSPTSQSRLREAVSVRWLR